MVKTFTLRLTEEQLEEVSRDAKELGLSKNDYIRKLIEGDLSISKADQILEELKELKELVKSK